MEPSDNPVGRPDPGSLAAFMAELERVPWFENLGKPVGPAAGVWQIAGWEEWPGPLDAAVLGMATRQQELYDELLAAAGERAAAAKALWERVHAVVFRDAAPRVPYDPNQDTYHGPTAAVWFAAWTAGLVALCRFLGRPVPPELAAQWQWFAGGHWPCGWVGKYPAGELMVY